MLVSQHWPSLETQAADYRIIVTAYEMPDGSTVQAAKMQEVADMVNQMAVSMEAKAEEAQETEPTEQA